MDSNNRKPFIDALEDEAYEQLEKLKQDRIYQGENPNYRQRAKTAIGVIGSYVRLRATMANEQTNRLVELRMLGSGDVPQLTQSSETTSNADRS